MFLRADKSRSRQPTVIGCARTRYLESSILEAECDQIQEVYELAEYDALRRRVLLTEVTQLFHKRLDFGGRAPLVQIDSTDNTLARLCILFELESRSLQVNRQGDVTDWTCGLKTGS